MPCHMLQFAVADKLVESSPSAEGLEAVWP